MRLIDADWVLAALGVFNDRKHGDAHFFNGIASAEEIVEHAPTIATRDWTPCAEGIPEIMKRVIVTICGEIVIAEREHELDDDETTPIHWYDDEGCRFNDDVVTAWMPMPEPWTGGLDGK